MSYRGRKGFTLIEVIVAIAVVAILAGIITPSIMKHLDDAKKARALNDCQVIGAAIASFYKDVGRWPTKDSASTYALTVLYGSGNLPSAGTTSWTLSGSTIDLLHNHLTRNAPMGSTSNAYSTTVAGASWNGPYQPTFPADPWGNAYVVNIGRTSNKTYVVWVLSAGPDSTINTAYAQSAQAATPPTTTNDDIGFRLQ